MKYILLLFTASFYGQVLHHQMISSQGATQKLSNGIIVKQTIGQQSVIGISKENYIVMQGFQQSFWNKYIASNYYSNIKTRTYPNPFINTVSFEFSEPIDQVVNVFIFDIGGHLVFKKSQKPIDKVLTFDLSVISGQAYLVQLQTDNFIHYTKIIKQ
ncbi:T9SS type A sorting domain-containing protein [Flavobacterium sp. W1B]|uniref:T9SS type A sorting domain-containing protein n=1 Tax=Flavobacterium sp. W1B TaxID=3394146 RepID=UPI0039BC8E92